MLYYISIKSYNDKLDKSINEKYHSAFISNNNTVVEITYRAWGIYLYVINDREDHPRNIIEVGIVILWNGSVYNQQNIYRKDGCSCTFTAVSATNYKCTVTGAGRYISVSLIFLNGFN